MDPLVLEASVRPEIGTQAGKQLRREGRVPAVVYGEGRPATPITTTDEDLRRVLRASAGGTVLITLRVTQPGGQRQPDQTVLIKEIQHHPVTSKILHADFHQVSLAKPIRVTVPIQLTGEPLGVTQEGGRLDHLLWELKIECLPTEIPPRIEVDVAALRIGDGLLIKDLAVSPKIKVLHDPQVAVVAVLPPIVEQHPGVAEPAAPVEPEVIKQKKPEPDAEPGEGPAVKGE